MNENLLLGLGVGAVVVVYAIMVIWWFAVQRQRRKEHAARQSSFVEALLRCIANDTLSSLPDLHNLFRAHFDQGIRGLADFEELSQLIRRATLKIASSESGSYLKMLHKSLPHLRSLLAENEEQVRQEQIRIPFSDAPSPERQLLEDILELTTNDKELVRSKLNELGKAIRIRQDTIKRLGTESHQSLVWAKWGLAGTVVFSLISIALAIWTLK